jgi:pimeloyl-ACP methyl ester carboxylesterase
VKNGTLEMIQSIGKGEPVIVVGNSMGAWVGSLLALERPDLVQRLILVNGGGKTAPGEGVSLVPANREEARKLMELLRSPDSPSVPGFVLDDIVRRAGRGPIGRIYQAADTIEAYLLDDRLNQIETPVDMLWGADDGFMTLDYAKAMAEEIPASRVTEIPSCGHIPHRECPVAFVSALVEVLEQEPPQRALPQVKEEDEPADQELAMEEGVEP